MKKIAAILLSVIMLIAAAGCSADSSEGNKTSGGFDINSAKTIGDLMTLNAVNTQWGTMENIFVYGFELNGSYYRFKAEMTPEQFESFMNIDFTEDDYEEQENKLISTFEIIDRQLMDDLILSQDELNALAGKTGQELFDAGWENGYGYNLEDSEFWLDYGPFCYSVIFEGEFQENDEIYDTYEYIFDRTVKSAKFRSIGDINNW